MKLQMNPAIAAIAGGTAGWRSQAGERASLTEVSHIHAIAVDPADPRRRYLATQYGVWHVAPDPGTPDRMFAATGESKILTSTDGGKSWAALSS